MVWNDPSHVRRVSTSEHLHRDGQLLDVSDSGFELLAQLAFNLAVPDSDPESL